MKYAASCVWFFVHAMKNKTIVVNQYHHYIIVKNIYYHSFEGQGGGACDIWGQI
jgi:hypothetical protein